MPLVSVVMPVHNAAATVARAVASIEAQTLRDWELLAVDDGSTDASRDILLELSAHDPRVRVLTIAKSGIVAALNAGLAAATGEHVARMDADDESHPERLAEQSARLAASSDTGLVSCRVEYGGDRAKGAGYALHVDWLNSVMTPGEIALNRFIESPFAHPSVMFRRALVEEFGGYAEGEFPEDYDLWLRWLDADVRMEKIGRPLVTWNDAPERLSRRDTRYSIEAFYQLKARWLAEWLRREVSPGRAIWIWGAGRPTRQRVAYLAERGVAIAGYIDVDVKKINREVGGIKVVGPDAMPPAENAFVLGYVGTRGAREYIRTDLVARGRVEGKDFLMCA